MAQQRRRRHPLSSPIDVASARRKPHGPALQSIAAMMRRRGAKGQTFDRFTLATVRGTLHGLEQSRRGPQHQGKASQHHQGQAASAAPRPSCRWREDRPKLKRQVMHRLQACRGLGVTFEPKGATLPSQGRTAKPGERGYQVSLTGPRQAACAHLSGTECSRAIHTDPNTSTRLAKLSSTARITTWCSGW